MQAFWHSPHHNLLQRRGQQKCFTPNPDAANTWVEASFTWQSFVRGRLYKCTLQQWSPNFLVLCDVCWFSTAEIKLSVTDSTHFVISRPGRWVPLHYSTNKWDRGVSVHCGDNLAKRCVQLLKVVLAWEYCRIIENTKVGRITLAILTWRAVS